MILYLMLLSCSSTTTAPNKTQDTNENPLEPSDGFENRDEIKHAYLSPIDRSSIQKLIDNLNNILKPLFQLQQNKTFTPMLQTTTSPRSEESILIASEEIIEI